ncbi:MAG: hypothetical protein KGD63_08125 [Candidatus Lokiarchaeota archaeon]|nr:hypothetical protein [Candidatus Lokiarchaeota archaeon]
MRKNTNKPKVFFGIFLVLAFVMSNIFMLTITQNNVINYNDDDYIDIETQDFSSEDYSSILEEEKNSLGYVSVLNLSYNKAGFHLSPSYSELDEEYSNSALVLNYSSTQFMETTQKASNNYISQEYIDNKEILIKLNETIVVHFDNALDPDINGLEGYMVYAPRLSMENVLEVYINNTEIDETDFSLNGDYLFFHYYKYYNYAYTKEAFIMNIIYTYKLSLASWQISQLEIEDLALNESSQEFNPDYNYGFRLQGYEFKDSGPASGTILSQDLVIKLNVSLYDRDNLSDYSLELNNEQIIDIADYLDIDNNVIINLTDNFRGNNSEFSLDFKTNFTIEFLDSVDKSWAIDRLKTGRYLRERIYFPTIVTGPDHLLFKFSFFESTILIDSIQTSYSQFGRIVDVLDANVTEDSPITIGIKITTPSLINNEIACPFIIAYNAIKTVRLIITDNVNMPAWDIDVSIYYFNTPYGTYISNDKTYPIPQLVPDENGEMVLEAIPLGEYNIEIYQNGNLVKEQLLNITSLNEEIVYIHTNLFHFPTVIIIFGLISAGLFSIGFIFYQKNKKR